uniref:Uncharacterized protein n=1 Tax=Steinernema glaseri TaxID=37863 RepID=A0A1I7ZJW0_9BILA
MACDYKTGQGAILVLFNPQCQKSHQGSHQRVRVIQGPCMEPIPDIFLSCLAISVPFDADSSGDKCAVFDHSARFTSKEQKTPATTFGYSARLPYSFF